MEMNGWLKEQLQYAFSHREIRYIRKLNEYWFQLLSEVIIDQEMTSK